MLHPVSENMQRVKHLRQVFLIFYSIPFYFIQYVCLSNNAVFASLLFTTTQTMSHVDSVIVWLSRGSAQCPARYIHIQSHHTCSSVPLLLFAVDPVLNAEKIDIH